MSLTLSLLRRQGSRAPARILFGRRTAATRATQSAEVDKSELPPVDTWRKVFGASALAIRDRISVANTETGYTLAQAFLSGKSAAAGKGKTVIESFPGPGALSRGLLQLESDTIEKLIILEENELYLEYLRPLEKDPRVRVVPMSGFVWDTYSYLEEQGELNHIKHVPFEDGMHPQLHFISHIPQNVKGEQLIAQLFRSIGARQWLFKYGAVPMSFVMGEWIFERVTAERKSKPRCKLSVIAEATSNIQMAVRPSALQPYNIHFHPQTSNYQTSKPENRRIGHPLVAVNFVPHTPPLIDPNMLEKWDYCLRKLFVVKGTPLSKAITGLGPGAESLLKALDNPQLPADQRVDITQKIRELTVADWALIIRAFDKWPFAPEDLIMNEIFTMSRHQRDMV